MTKNYSLSHEHFQGYPGYRKTNLAGAVEEICFRNDIDFVNLFTEFSTNNPETLFFKYPNAHWNDRGQDLAARETASYLMREFYLPEPTDDKSTGEEE